MTLPKCPDCGKPAVCAEHGVMDIESDIHSMDNSTYFWCNRCVVQYGTALGAIIHWCNEGKFFKEAGVEPPRIINQRLESCK